MSVDSGAPNTFVIPLIREISPTTGLRSTPGLGSRESLSSRRSEASVKSVRGVSAGSRDGEKPLFLGVGQNIGLSIDSVWGSGLAPIHLAALHGRLDCLKLLIEKQKVNVNLPSTTGWKPIHLCVSNQTGDRAVRCLNYLLQHGADPNAVNEDGVTPVHQAASEGHIQCMKILIERGALIEARDARGHRPIDLAKLWGHRKCARILASERWRQEKAGAASDMVQLRKEKMEQVIRDLDNEERQQADSTFYGQLAFNEWLDKHSLPPNAKTEPKNAKNRSKKGRKNDDIESESNKTASNKTERDSATVKPNSVNKNQESKNDSKKQVKTKPVIDPNAKTVEVKKEDVNIQTPTVESVEIERETAPENNPEIPERNWTKFENPIPWNTSCHVPDTFNEYVPNLSDAYPRDEFTMMPTKNATPYDLNVRNPKIFVTDDRERVKRADDLVNVRERLSQVNIEALPSDEQTLKPVLRKCKAVQDLPKRRPVTSLPTVRVCEGGMHLTDDLSSPLFKAGLIIDLPRSDTTGSTLSSTAG